jgi:hypothetical protein
MPVSALAEFILWPLFELAFHVFGYLTGYLIVPILSIGHYSVEPIFSRKRKISGKSYRASNSSEPGELSAEAAALIGLLFWVVFVAIGVLIWR